MMSLARQLVRVGLLLGVMTTFFGCASSSVAPVVYGGGVHIVKKGDTLYGIAFARGLRYQDLAALNGIGPPYTIYPGQRLSLHKTGIGNRRVVHKAAPVATPRHSPPVRHITHPPPKVVRKPAVRVVRAAPSPAARAVSGTGSKSSVTVGGVRWAWPTRGKVIKVFSASAEGKKGLDIAGKAGQPIVAAADGKIVYAGSGLRGYGKLIIIEHNKKYLSAYAHNRQLKVTEGDRVAQGQPIAEMGKTGTSRTMLHFEIRRDGQSVDPKRYLPRKNP
jgi:lipoprotein NlpD